MKVGEFCNREVIIIERQESALDAAKLMRVHHVGDVIVVDKSDTGVTPIGILTDRDIVIEIVAKAIDPGSVTAGDAMSYDLVTAREEDDLMETIKIQRSRGIRRIPIVNEQGELVGILAVDDVLEIITEQLSDLVGLVTMERHREMNTRA
jgi:predicted transcriptional regulator